MSDIALRIEGLGKRYRLGLQDNAAGGMYRYKSLRDSLGSLSKHPFRTLKDAVARKPMDEDNSFWALKDVNFEVKKGEVVGIIGRNGAGKSTLLKVLSRITKPTTGRVDLFGRVGSLLEVGTGFHPELSGRENIYLNGAILGMTRAEVTLHFDDIVEFAGVHRFIDTAVKQYSSGMYVRLAFAVAAHLDVDLLIIDEVLAVGDIAFQKRCVDRMESVARSGKTVLVVSHDLTLIRSLATRVTVLDYGRVTASGEPTLMVDRFVRQLVRTRERSDDLSAFRRRQSDSRGILINSVACAPTPGSRAGHDVGCDLEVSITVESTEVVPTASIILVVKDSAAQPVLSICSEDVEVAHTLRVGLNQFAIKIPRNPLFPGNYLADVRIAPTFGSITFDWIENLPLFEIGNTGPFAVPVWLDRSSVVAPGTLAGLQFAPTDTAGDRTLANGDICLAQ